MFLNFGFISISILVLLLISAFRILREYERGVIFMLGRFYKVKGPGFILVIPLIQQMVRVDLRTIVMDVPTQDVISRDNVSIKVNAVAGCSANTFAACISFSAACNSPSA
jgi:regulator of protease activity HflC (stomatin/prohibitin superfamily)